MHPVVSYLIGLLPAGLIILLLVLNYERQLRMSRNIQEGLQKQNDKLLVAVMAVDYEKLREVEIKANADAQIAWAKVAYTNEFGDIIQDLQEAEVPYAKPTS